MKMLLPIRSKYLHAGYHLLQVASLLPKLPTKLCSLIPQGSHSIVRVLLSGMITLYRFFKKAHANNLLFRASFIRKVPLFLK